MYCKAGKEVVWNNVLFEGNKAGEGGAFYGRSPCKASFSYVSFHRNQASTAGAAVAVSDGVVLDFEMSDFVNNGQSDCRESSPPEVR